MFLWNILADLILFMWQPSNRKINYSHPFCKQLQIFWREICPLSELSKQIFPKLKDSDVLMHPKGHALFDFVSRGEEEWGQN